MFSLFLPALPKWLGFRAEMYIFILFLYFYGYFLKKTRNNPLFPICAGVQDDGNG